MDLRLACLQALGRDPERPGLEWVDAVLHCNRRKTLAKYVQQLPGEKIVWTT